MFVMMTYSKPYYIRDYIIGSVQSCLKTHLFIVSYINPLTDTVTIWVQL